MTIPTLKEFLMSDILPFSAYDTNTTDISGIKQERLLECGPTTKKWSLKALANFDIEPMPVGKGWESSRAYSDFIKCMESCNWDTTLLEVPPPSTHLCSIPHNEADTAMAWQIQVGIPMFYMAKNHWVNAKAKFVQWADFHLLYESYVKPSPNALVPKTPANGVKADNTLVIGIKPTFLFPESQQTLEGKRIKAEYTYLRFGSTWTKENALIAYKTVLPVEFKARGILAIVEFGLKELAKTNPQQPFKISKNRWKSTTEGRAIYTALSFLRQVVRCCHEYGVLKVFATDYETSIIIDVSKDIFGILGNVSVALTLSIVAEIWQKIRWESVSRSKGKLAYGFYTWLALGGIEKSMNGLKKEDLVGDSEG